MTRSISEHLQPLRELGQRPPPDELVAALSLWASDANGVGYLRRSAELEAAVQAVKDCGVTGARSLVLSALRDAGHDVVVSESDQPDDLLPATYGGGVLDLVELADGDLGLLVVRDGEVLVVPDLDGLKPWPRRKLPWTSVPSAEAVLRALQDGGAAPIHQEAGRLRWAVVLPTPEWEWSYLLSAWTLGTYLLDRFNYYPLVRLQGQAERGKTRLAKALVYPAFRGVVTSSQNAAPFFRDRAHHGVSLCIDVESLERVLERSDLGDLVLSSFERDGVVRRVTRPDEEPAYQVETFSCYGATVVTSNTAIRDHSPLASRCLAVALPEAGTRVVPPATSATDREVLDLRSQSLAWLARLERDGEELPDVRLPFGGRLRDLSRPLVQVLAATAPEQVDGVVELLRELDRDRRREVSSRWEARVAVALWECRSQVREGRVYYDDLREAVNRGVPAEEELSGQRIGYVRKALGLRADRGGPRGAHFLYWPGEETARALWERYRVPSEEASENCSESPDPSDSAETSGSPALTTLEAEESAQQVLSLGDQQNSRPSDHSGDSDGFSGPLSKEGGRP